MFAENYRSLKSIRMDLTGVNLFIGENGVGKSNLYRALQLIQSATRGTLAREIAEEGGMSSALWSGRRRADKPARIRLETEPLDEERAITFRYRIEAGLVQTQAFIGMLFGALGMLNLLRAVAAATGALLPSDFGGGPLGAGIFVLPTIASLLALTKG